MNTDKSFDPTDEDIYESDEENKDPNYVPTELTKEDN